MLQEIVFSEVEDSALQVVIPQALFNAPLRMIENNFDKFGRIYTLRDLLEQNWLG